MDSAEAIQRLANYSKRNCRASREIFEAGIIIRDDASRKLGDDSARPFSLHTSRSWSTLYPSPHPLHSITRSADHSISGWQFLESLALASIDVGRIDVAEVSDCLSPKPTVSLYLVLLAAHQNTDL
jgi:hypothetical protein